MRVPHTRVPRQSDFSDFSFTPRRISQSAELRVWSGRCEVWCSALCGFGGHINLQAARLGMGCSNNAWIALASIAFMGILFFMEHEFADDPGAMTAIGAGEPLAVHRGVPPGFDREPDRKPVRTGESPAAPSTGTKFPQPLPSDAETASDSHVPEGYAFNKPSLGLDDLEICRVSAGGPKVRQLVCRKTDFENGFDPTCKACIQNKFLERAEHVHALLVAEQERSKREKRYREQLGPAGSVVVVVATNKLFMDLTLNFACSAKARGFWDQLKMLVVVTDAESAAAANKSGLFAVEAREYGIEPATAEDLSNHPRLGFIDTMMAVTAVSADLVGLGYRVVVQDADVAWVRSPLWRFENPKLSGMDLQFQLAPRWDGQGVSNTGFILARPTARCRIFLQSLVRASALYAMAGDDQIVWNTLLRHFHFSMLRWTTLPRRIRGVGHTSGRYMDLNTRTGKDGTAPWIDKDTVIVHAVAGSQSNKEKTLALTGNWYLNKKTGECSPSPLRTPQS